MRHGAWSTRVAASSGSAAERGAQGAHAEALATRVLHVVTEGVRRGLAWERDVRARGVCECVCIHPASGHVTAHRGTINAQEGPGRRGRHRTDIHQFTARFGDLFCPAARG